MEYLKVWWLHNFADEPYLFLCELDENRFEARKLEFYRDGRIGYACEDRQTGDTLLGELEVPSGDEIAADPQFVVGELTQAEFEDAWRKATGMPV